MPFRREEEKGIANSGIFRRIFPKGKFERRMRQMDFPGQFFGFPSLEIYMETPFYGVPRLTAELKRRGYRVRIYP